MHACGVCLGIQVQQTTRTCLCCLPPHPAASHVAARLAGAGTLAPQLLLIHLHQTCTWQNPAPASHYSIAGSTKGSPTGHFQGCCHSELHVHPPAAGPRTESASGKKSLHCTAAIWWVMASSALARLPPTTYPLPCTLRQQHRRQQHWQCEPTRHAKKKNQCK